MKKLILILVSVLCTFTSYSQVKIIQGAEMEYNFSSKLRLREYTFFGPLSIDYHRPPIAAKYRIGVLYHKFSFNTYTSIYMFKGRGFQFNPGLAIFKANLSYQVSNKIKVSLQHACIHPIISDNTEYVTKVYGGNTCIKISYNYE